MEVLGALLAFFSFLLLGVFLLLSIYPKIISIVMKKVNPEWKMEFKRKHTLLAALACFFLFILGASLIDTDNVQAEQLSEIEKEKAQCEAAQEEAKKETAKLKKQVEELEDKLAKEQKARQKLETKLQQVKKEAEEQKKETAKKETETRKQQEEKKQEKSQTSNTMAYNGPYDPHGPDRDCGDFATAREAQAFYLAAGGPAKDPHDLDRDNDGNACNWNP